VYILLQISCTSYCRYRVHPTADIVYILLQISCTSYCRYRVPPTADIVYILLQISCTSYCRYRVPPTADIVYILLQISCTSYCRYRVPPTADIVYLLLPISCTSYCRPDPRICFCCTSRYMLLLEDDFVPCPGAVRAILEAVEEAEVGVQGSREWRWIPRWVWGQRREDTGDGGVEDSGTEEQARAAVVFLLAKANYVLFLTSHHCIAFSTCRFGPPSCPRALTHHVMLLIRPSFVPTRAHSSCYASFPRRMVADGSRSLLHWVGTEY
jgi:uncharacterized protein YuzE